MGACPWPHASGEAQGRTPGTRAGPLPLASLRLRPALLSSRKP